MNIHDRAKQIATNYKKATQLMLEILIEVEKKRAFEDHNYTFLTPYCVNYLKLDPEIAQTLVRIVKKSTHVPELAQAVIEGKIHVSNAKVIAAVITPENQKEWITKATKLKKKDLEKEVSKNGGPDNKKLTLNLPTKTLELLERARDVASSKSANFETLEATIHAALEEYIYRNDPVEKADRARGPRSHETKRSLKNQVNERDRGRCGVIYEDGTQCEEEKWIDHHHQIPKSEGGADTLDNMISMCKGHHRLHHKHH